MTGGQGVDGRGDEVSVPWYKVWCGARLDTVWWRTDPKFDASMHRELDWEKLGAVFLTIALAPEKNYASSVANNESVNRI
jgi:hypothetical protein